MNLNELSGRAHGNSRAKGFWDDEYGAQQVLEFPSADSSAQKFANVVLRYATPVRLALIHSEASEVLENDRKEAVDEANEAEELADLIIRIGDLAGFKGIDLDKAVEAKMARNEERPPLHGKRY